MAVGLEIGIGDLESGLGIRIGNWGLGLGLWIGMGVGLGIGIGDWGLVVTFGFDFGCDFWL